MKYCVRVASAAVVVTVALAGCGGSSSDEPSSQKVTTTEATTGASKPDRAPVKFTQRAQLFDPSDEEAFFVSAGLLVRHDIANQTIGAYSIADGTPVQVNIPAIGEGTLTDVAAGYDVLVQAVRRSGAGTVELVIQTLPDGTTVGDPIDIDDIVNERGTVVLDLIGDRLVVSRDTRTDNGEITAPVRVYDTTTGQLAFPELTGQNVAVSGATVAVGGDDGVKAYDLESGDLKWSNDEMVVVFGAGGMLGLTNGGWVEAAEGEVEEEERVGPRLVEVLVWPENGDDVSADVTAEDSRALYEGGQGDQVPVGLFSADGAVYRAYDLAGRALELELEVESVEDIIRFDDTIYVNTGGSIVAFDAATGKRLSPNEVNVLGEPKDFGLLGLVDNYLVVDGRLFGTVGFSD